MWRQTSYRVGEKRVTLPRVLSTRFAVWPPADGMGVPCRSDLCAEHPTALDATALNGERCRAYAAAVHAPSLSIYGPDSSTDAATHIAAQARAGLHGRPM